MTPPNSAPEAERMAEIEKRWAEYKKGASISVEECHARDDIPWLLARVRALMQENERLTAEVERLTEERDELQATFDLRRDAQMRAIKRWQEAHPGNDLVWPDHADLVVWLLETRA